MKSVTNDYDKCRGGVIANFGQGALGVADCRECKSSTEPEPLSTRRKVSAVVVGYDENNQWLVLGSPQVHDEELTLGQMERLRSS